MPTSVSNAVRRLCLTNRSENDPGVFTTHHQNLSGDFTPSTLGVLEDFMKYLRHVRCWFCSVENPFHEILCSRCGKILLRNTEPLITQETAREQMESL